jgi:signal transduction histidine kinase
MAAALHEQGTQLRLELPEQLPPLRADADRLMQVLLNLLGNAAKFVPRPGGLITLRLRADADTATVQVQDNGPGVPPEQRARIFERFQQGGDPGQRPAGTGLGLPISRQIVEHFGGRIVLRSDTTQGACFEFSLPWQQKETNPGDKR